MKYLFLIGLLLIASPCFATIDRVCYVNDSTDEVGTVMAYTEHNYNTMVANCPEGYSVEIVSVEGKSKKLVNDFEDATKEKDKDKAKKIKYHKLIPSIEVE